jgi:hypothetical protein
MMPREQTPRAGRIRDSANPPAEQRQRVTALPLDMVEDSDRRVDTLPRRAYPGP